MFLKMTGPAPLTAVATSGYIPPVDHEGGVPLEEKRKRKMRRVEVEIYTEREGGKKRQRKTFNRRTCDHISLCNLIMKSTLSSKAMCYT